MTGIYLLFVAALWLAFVVWFSKAVTKKLPTGRWRVPVAIVVFALVSPLPLIDEIIGGRQFEQLCKDNAEIQVNRAAAAGKTVYYVPEPSIEIKNIWLHAVRQPYRYVDSKTGDFVMSYSTLTASGGRFIQALGISEGGMPLTFIGSCGPAVNPQNLFKELAVIALDRPQTNTKGKLGEIGVRFQLNPERRFD